MLNLPDKMNGYTIISAMPVIRRTSPPSFLEDGEGIILGQDLTRRDAKWVVAHVPLALADQPTEWFWGFYTNNLVSALDRFIEKTDMKLAFEPQGIPDSAFPA